MSDKGLIVPGGRFIPDGTVTRADRFRGAEPIDLPEPFGFTLDTAPFS